MSAARDSIDNGRYPPSIVSTLEQPPCLSHLVSATLLTLLRAPPLDSSISDTLTSYLSTSYPNKSQALDSIFRPHDRVFSTRRLLYSSNGRFLLQQTPTNLIVPGPFRSPMNPISVSSDVIVYLSMWYTFNASYCFEPLLSIHRFYLTSRATM